MPELMSKSPYHGMYDEIDKERPSDNYVRQYLDKVLSDNKSKKT